MEGTSEISAPSNNGHQKQPLVRVFQQPEPKADISNSVTVVFDSGLAVRELGAALDDEFAGVVDVLVKEYHGATGVALKSCFHDLLVF